MKPCPTGAPPATTCAFTADCDRNEGLMPDRNIAATMTNGHRLFAPSLLKDIHSSFYFPDPGASSLASAAAHHRRVGGGTAGHDR
jgi:hypothetical protein